MGATIIMNKLKNSNGMTLTELLAATLIMLLVTVGLTTGIALSNKEFVASIRQSEAQELFSTLQSLINNELRYTNQVSYDDNGDVTSFFSVTYALKENPTYSFVILKSNDEGDDEETTINYGELAIGNNGTYKRLIGDGNYPYNLGAMIKTFKYDADNKLFTVELDIGTDDGGSIISKTFNVRAINMVD